MSGKDHKGVCVEHQVSATQAVSPAFVEGDLSTTKYSTWTEANWKFTRARIFLKPSSLQEWITFVTGVIIAGLSFLLVFFINKKSNIIFGSEGEENGTYLYLF